MKKLIAFIMALGLLMPLRVWAGSDTGADFLKIPVGARSTALGQSFASTSEGPEALNWNPAGLAPGSDGFSFKTGLSLSHQELTLDNNLDQFGLVFPGSGRLSLGLNLVRMSYASQERRDANRRVTGSLDSSDSLVGLSAAHRLGDIRMGTQLKLIHQELGGDSANGMAMDLGLISRTPFAPLTLGVSARNMGPRMRLVEDRYRLPTTVSLGAGYRLSAPLSIGLDLQSRTHDGRMVLAMGTEFLASPTVALRAGYLAKLADTVTNRQRSESNRGNFQGIDGLTAGIGIRFRQLSLDYALAPYGELGYTQSLTLNSYFGGRTEKNREEKETPEETPPNNEKLSVPITPADKWWQDLK